jgi:hypothetical protein
VLRCPDCGELEHGQLYAAEDAGLLEATPRFHAAGRRRAPRVSL